MKPLKIKLKDHHADGDRINIIHTIRTEYEISLIETNKLIAENWHLTDSEFAIQIENILSLNYKERVEIKTHFNLKDMEAAYNEGANNAAKEIANENQSIFNREPLEEVTFEMWIKTYKS